MLIEYQNTLPDFREGSSAISRASHKRKLSTRVLGIGVWLVLWLVLRIIINRLGSPEESGAAWIHVIIPIVAVIAFFNAMGIIAILRGQVKFRFTRRRIIWLLTLAVSIFCLWITRWLSPRAGIVKSWPWNWRLLIPHTTWLLFLAGIGLTVIRNNFRSLERKWEGQPNLRRFRTADISADGVVISDSDSHLQYRWSSFLRWEETPTLFLLVIGGPVCHILPKRAFISDENLKAFRAMARAISGNKTVGFPVEAIHIARSPVPNAIAG